MTNAWHMFALSPSPRGEACSRRLYIAECVCLCIYATEGKVTARCRAQGACSYGSDLSVRHKRMSPSCGKSACTWSFGDLHRTDTETLGLVLCSGRGGYRDGAADSGRCHTPRSLTAGVTRHFEVHSKWEEQVHMVQQPVPGVFAHLQKL